MRDRILMKVLVTGLSGQLGYDVALHLIQRGHRVIGTSRSKMTDIKEIDKYIPLDITDSGKLNSLILSEKPDAVIHCAAWTAVDAAEDHPKEVFEINEKATRIIAEACKEVEVKLLYLSTDYVFSGDGNRPWTAEESDYAPLNVYGQSKLAGEMAIKENIKRYYIVRIAWVFGSHGNNFVKTMLKLADQHEKLTVVDDQIGSPTYTHDLARLLVDMIESDKYGTYHVTNTGGYISWADFAKEIFKQTGKNVQVIPVTTAEYGKSKAKRPFNSRLNQDKLVEQGFKLLPPWQDALSCYLREIKDE